MAYALNLRELEPTAEDLLSPQWHREAPVRLMMKRLAVLLPTLYERYGERGVKALQFVFYQVGVDRAPVMRDALQIDPSDARSLGRVLDYEDHMVGVRGIWTEECRGRAVKEERYCPAASELTRCPEVCTKLMMAMEAGTFSVINPGSRRPSSPSSSRQATTAAWPLSRCRPTRSGRGPENNPPRRCPERFRRS